MAFGKIKQTRFNVEAFYHTVTKVNIDLSIVPDPILDENNQIIGYKGGSKSFVTLASYKDKDSYLSKSFSLSQKTYEFDFVTTTAVVNSTEKTCKEAAYDLIKTVDDFWIDAEIV